MWRVSALLTKLDFKLADSRQELGPINLVSGTCVSRRVLLKYVTPTRVFMPAAVGLFLPAITELLLANTALAC